LKVRHGFVSNSSSSSFCLLGVNLTSGVSDEVEDRVYKSDWLDIENGLEDIEGVVIGISPNRMLENKDVTVRMVLDSLVTELNKCLDTPVTIDDIRVYNDQGYE
jgi:hypothetical protein